MNEDSENRILTMLTEITSRLAILEDNNQVIFNNSMLDNLDNVNGSTVFAKQSRKGSSTLHVAESYVPTSSYTSTLTIPTFDNQLLYLKPRAVIRFTSAVHTYEYTYGIKANLSKCFKYEIQQQLCSYSDGLYNISTIGTISLKDFIKITRKYLQVYTQGSFLKQLSKSSFFPANNINDLDLNSLATFRNLIKQYTEEFIMLVDLLSNNIDSIPPLVNTKDTGLIWQFNKAIPFGFGEGLYRQIGFIDGKKVTFKTINEYCDLVNKRMSDFHEFSNLIIPFFDAITNPADKPRMLKLPMKENVKILDHTDEDDVSTIFSSGSLSTDIDIVNLLPPPNKLKQQPVDRADKPCFRMATDGSCDVQQCKYSHSPEVINKCRSELMSKLKKHTT